MATPTLPTFTTANWVTLLTYPSSFAATKTVKASGGDYTSLQSAIDWAASQAGSGNYKIVVDSGMTFAMSAGIVLPARSGTGWIVVEPSTLPTAIGYRAKSTHTASMYKITSAQSDYPSVRNVADTKPSRYRLIGAEICPATSGYFAVQVGHHDYDGSESVIPEYIVFDRCYIHGNSGVGEWCRNGVALNGHYMALINSSVQNIREEGNEAHGVWFTNGSGPYLTENNYIEATTINWFTGGANPVLGFSDGIPCDITVRRNHMKHLLSYVNTSYTTKNQFELKFAKRVLCEQNIFENNWVESDQQGFSVVFTPRYEPADYSYQPLVVVEDVTFRNNKILNTSAGVNILGKDSGSDSGLCQRVLIQNNLWTLTTALPCSQPRTFRLLEGPVDVQALHNTFVGDFHTDVWISSDQYDRMATGFIFRDNLMKDDVYYVLDGHVNTCNGTLAAWTTDPVFTSNAFIGADYASQSPSGNFFPATVAAVEFEDYNGGDYQLAVGSDYRAGGAYDASDGTDMGCDIAALNVALLGVEDGDPGGAPPPSPPTGSITLSVR